MAKRLFLLDGMALVYRAHFALIARPIFTSKGVNTSALYGFTQTLLDILNKQQPTHIAVAFDTDAPTQRHVDLSRIQGHAPGDARGFVAPRCRMCAACSRPSTSRCSTAMATRRTTSSARSCAARRRKGSRSYMVTPDKDFGQLVDENTFSTNRRGMGDGVEILGMPEILRTLGRRAPRAGHRCARVDGRCRRTTFPACRASAKKRPPN